MNEGEAVLEVEVFFFSHTLHYEQHQCASSTVLEAPRRKLHATLVDVLSFYFSFFHSRHDSRLIQLALEINEPIIAHLHLHFPSRSWLLIRASIRGLCVRPCASVFGLYGELVGLFFYLPNPRAPPHAGCPLLI